MFYLIYHILRGNTVPAPPQRYSPLSPSPHSHWDTIQAIADPAKRSWFVSDNYTHDHRTIVDAIATPEIICGDPAWGEIANSWRLCAAISLGESNKIHRRSYFAAKILSIYIFAICIGHRSYLPLRLTRFSIYTYTILPDPCDGAMSGIAPPRFLLTRTA